MTPVLTTGQVLGKGLGGYTLAAHYVESVSQESNKKRKTRAENQYSIGERELEKEYP